MKKEFLVFVQYKNPEPCPEERKRRSLLSLILLPPVIEQNRIRDLNIPNFGMSTIQVTIALLLVTA